MIVETGRSFMKPRQSADLEARAALIRLMSSVAAGERQALQRLYEATSPKLFGIVLAVLSNRAEAEEVLQDVFVAIWEKADRYDPARGSPIAWLATVARNRAVDRRRALQGWGEVLSDEMLEAAPHDGPSPLDTLEDDQERERLYGCLQTLEKRMRIAISEAFLHGDTYQILARRHGVPLGTMKSWIRRSLIKLRECLEP